MLMKLIQCLHNTPTELRIVASSLNLATAVKTTQLKDYYDY